jgi:D-glycero-alpha-D-manno-heptose-7-phosphate kinase
MQMSDGKQDQYSATFGGFNFMEFYKEDKVIVNPLRIKKRIVSELEMNTVLYYTGTSRLSAKIIDSQVANVLQKESKSIEAMHSLKEQAQMMKNALLRGELEKIGEILHFGWEQKKLMSKEISNPMIDAIYAAARGAGATGGKISGAGGGGFMFFYCPENTKYKVMKALSEFGGDIKPFQFVEEGLVSWVIGN